MVFGVRTYTSPPPSWCLFRGDKGKLRQWFLTSRISSFITRNKFNKRESVRFSRSGNTISLFPCVNLQDNHYSLIGAEPGGGVSESGGGFAVKNLDHVFSHFVTVDAERLGGLD